MSEPAQACVQTEAAADVVIIDDDELTLEFYRRTLRRAGAPSRTFLDAAEAMTQFRQQPARLLFVDSRMPLIDGIDVLETLHGEGLLDQTTAFLCSAARPPSAICTRAEEIGVSVLLKETQLNKAGLLALLTELTAAGDSSHDRPDAGCQAA